MAFEINDVQSTRNNPQSNSICIHMHQRVGNDLLILLLLHSNPPQNLTQARYIVDQALTPATCHLSHSGYHTRQHVSSPCIQLQCALKCSADSKLSNDDPVP